jgi:acetyltransferase-like isoleucine patch superfamily enzyme
MIVEWVAGWAWNIQIGVEYMKFFKIFVEIFKKKEVSVAGVTIRRPDLVTIGERVSFGGNVRIFNKEKVKIGDDCLIAWGVQIITSSHDYYNTPIWKERIDRPIEIGNDVFIGTNAIILSGVKIGNHSVIGAGAVVSSYIPGNVVAVGNPARIIKKIVPKERDFSCKYPGIAIQKDFFPQAKQTKNYQNN